MVCRAQTSRAVRLAAVMIALASEGCATAPPPLQVVKWSKTGATYDDYLKDRYACLLDSRSQASRGLADRSVASEHSGQVLSGALVVACFAAHGWTRDSNGFGPPEGGAVRIGQ